MSENGMFGYSTRTKSVLKLIDIVFIFKDWSIALLIDENNKQVKIRENEI